MHDVADDTPSVLRLPSVRSSAGATAADLVLVYEAIDGLPDKVARVQEATERSVAGRGADAAIAAAALAIAGAVDADRALHDRQPYHNRQHFCEVMLAVELLCRVHDVAAQDAQLVLLAALVHDLDHDGEPSRTFRLERRSLESAAPYLADAGVEPAVMRQLAVLVLATQPGQGTLAALRAGAFHATGAALPRPADEAPELAELARDKRLARLALLLCEADLLPSVALTFAHAMRIQQRLAREWGRPLGAKEKLHFQQGVLASGVIGPFFRPNALAIRRALVDRVHGTHER